MKSVMRFGKKRKLSARYIGPYRISKRTNNVAYEFELAQELEAVHPVFHMSMLKKCMDNPSLIVSIENIGIKDILSYDEVPFQILDRQVHKLRTKEVASVKVLWRNQLVEEGTWEAEEDMKKRYPHLFESGEIPNQGQVTDRGSCPWIDARTAQLQYRLTVNQHRPSFDPRSIGQTVQILSIQITLRSVPDLQFSRISDRRRTHGPSRRSVVRVSNFPRTQPEIRLSVDPCPDLRSVGQVTNRGSCPWINAPKAQLQS
ncbi:hypothetical protein MTR67_034200 [Solanum verrucosum]|uniref:Chromo domain-containing protein n=1 Tax=Solanum verrucosum TaxID=315347 RepID=A0AAF0U7S2_SOLVR|nr:hypothetical protein MTR67_034200 [Solanum verrucosum]